MLGKVFQLFTRLLKIGTRRPQDLQHVFGIANWAAGQILDPEADIRSLAHESVEDLAGKPLRWQLQLFPGVEASVSPMECVALAALITRTNASKVFEFGTYKGVSTTQLASNLPPHGMVYTLDLPEDHPAYSLPILKESEREIAAESGKGILVPADLRQKVTFLRHDSATFDPAPYEGQIDLVFVDGAHSFDYVKNDTQKALRMLKPGGIVAWHDCAPNHRDVVRYLKSFDKKVTLIEGTTIAFATKS